MKLRFRTKLIPIILGLACVVGSVFLQVNPPQGAKRFLTELNYFIYDMRVFLTLGRTPKLPNIVIINIDEKSLKAEGRWPWPRDKIAKLVDKLREAGVVVVAMDMIFAEPEKNLLQQIQDRLKAAGIDQPIPDSLSVHRDKFDNDKILAQALKGQESVLGFILHNDKNASKGTLPKAILALNLQDPKHNLLTIFRFDGFIGNTPDLQNAAGHAGVITAIRDEDGVVRRYPLVLRHNNKLYPSLAMATIKQYLLFDDFKFDIQQVGDQYKLEAIQMGKLRVPTDKNGQVIIPYWGKRQTIPYYSATDILHGNFNQEKLIGAIAFIGTDALGLGELQATPADKQFPGVEIHANVAASILMNKFPYEPVWALGAEVSAIVLLGLLLALLLPILNAWNSAILFLGTLAAVVVSDLILWVNEGVFFSIGVLVLMIIVLALLNLIYAFGIERRYRLNVENLFGEYVPPQHVEAMTYSNKRYDMSGESKNMTVLFADIRNFTAISEKLGADGVKRLLNEFFTPITEIIFQHEGTIDKYVGDMVMAFWGAPLEDDQHPLHAVKAAIAMLAKTEVLKEEFKEKDLPDVSIGIGINTGNMNVGDMGSKYRRSYTVIGDAVNLASRLQDLNKYYHTSLLVSKDTMQAAPDIAWCKVDRITVKGREEPLSIYAPFEADDLSQLDTYHRALEAFFEQDWDQSEKLFRELKQQDPQTYLYELYLSRIAEYRTNPPPADWDGVYRHVTK